MDLLLHLFQEWKMPSCSLIRGLCGVGVPDLIWLNTMKHPQLKFLHQIFLMLCALQMSMAAFPTLHLRPVVLDQLHSPTAITGANDGSGRVFVCDQPGRIFIVQDGMILPVPFLDISNTAATVAHRKVLGLASNYDERGLLGLAFHTGFSNPSSAGYRKFYLNYNKTYQAGIDPAPPVADHTPNCTTVIAEFQVSATNPNVADPLSERRLLLFSQPQSNHNGGGMVFGSDGLLYIAAGDGGSSNDNNVGHTGGSAARPTGGLGNSQDKTRFLGKILRIQPLDPDGAGPLVYGIPGTNPFVGAGGGVKEEIFAFGIRNPWGLCFDNRPGGTGRLFCADVGQGRVEEINVIVSGGNYGWRYLEGTERPTFSSTMAHPGGTLISPIAQYAHPGASVSDPANPGFFLPELGLSVTGGFVYRGAAFPTMQGKYLFADYGATSGVASGRFMGLEETTPGVFSLTQSLPLTGPNPSAMRVLCLGEDDEGELYVGGKVTAGVLALQTGLPNGALYKIVPAPAVVTTTQLEPVNDNSIFSELGPLGDEMSNGTGNLFAGRTGAGENRRALLKFDVSSIPAGSSVISATLQMNVNATDAANPGARNFDLFRLREDWGEAGSFNATGPAIAQTNDATWDHRFYSNVNPIEWTFTTDMPYWTSTSATASLNGTGAYAWSYQLHGDVRSWLANPALNQGWILIGNEAVSGTAKQLHSRESAASVRPKLTVTHVPPSPYASWVASYFPTLPEGGFLSQGGENDVSIDYDRNGTTDLYIPTDKDGFSHLLEYAYGFSPLSANAAGSDQFTMTRLPGVGGSSDLMITFRRDSSATDLIYQLQISSDLMQWTIVAQSLTGSAAVGQNGGSVQSDVLLSGTVRLVTVMKNLAAGVNEKQFVRLRVTRMP
jgi:Glucose / Sorbosone dehydrogenase